MARRIFSPEFLLEAVRMVEARGVAVAQAYRDLAVPENVISGGHDGWLPLARVIDCHTRELLGWQLWRSDRRNIAVAALAQALISRFRSLGRLAKPFLLRSDNGLVFISRRYTLLVRRYGLKQGFITPHCPQRYGLVERVIRTLEEQCVPRHRHESRTHTMRHRRLDRFLQQSPAHEAPRRPAIETNMTFADPLEPFEETRELAHHLL